MCSTTATYASVVESNAATRLLSSSVMRDERANGREAQVPAAALAFPDAEAVGCVQRLVTEANAIGPHPHLAH